MADQLQTDIVLKAVNEASAQIRDVQASLAGLQTQLAKTTPQVNTFNDSLSSFGATMGKIGAGLTVGLTVPLVALGKAMVTQVAQLEQYKVAFDTMLGSASKGSAVLKQLSDFAIKTPFTLPSVTDAAKQLLAMGVTTEKLIPTLKSLGDVSSGTGAPLDRMVHTFGQIAIAGKASGVQMREFALNGVPLIDALAQELGKSKDEIEKMVSAGAISFPMVEQAFTNMTSSGGKFFDLMDKQSHTFTGIMSNLADQFTRVSASLLGLKMDGDQFGEVIKGGVFDMLKEGAQGALDAVTSLLSVFNDMSESTKKTIVTIGLVVASLGPLALVIAGITAAIGVLTTATGGVFAILSLTAVLLVALKDSGFGPLIAVVGSVAAAFIGVSSAMKAFGTASEFAASRVALLELALGPAGWIALGIGAIVGVVTLGIQKNAEYAASLKAVSDSLALVGKSSTIAKSGVEAVMADMAKFNKDKDLNLMQQKQVGAGNDIPKFNADIIKLLTSLGQTKQQIDDFTKGVDGMSVGLSTFHGNIEITQQDQQRVKEHIDLLSKSIDDSTNKFLSLVDNYKKGGADMTQATNLAVGNMQQQWKQAGTDFGTLEETFKEKIVEQVAQTQSLGEGLAQALALGLTSDQAKLAISNAGIEMNDTVVSTMIAQGAKKGGLKGAGEVDAGMWILGFDSKQRDAVTHSSDMVTAVTKALQSKIDAIYNAGITAGNKLVGGIIESLRKGAPAVFSLTNGLIKTLSLGSADIPTAGQGLVNFFVGLNPKLNQLKAAQTDFNTALKNTGGALTGMGDGADSASKKLEKLKQDFIDAQATFANNAGGALQDVMNGLSGGLSFNTATITDTSSLFTNLNGVLSDMKGKIKDLISEHQKFIDGIKKGIDDYGTELDKINKKYADMKTQLVSNTASDVGNLLESSISDKTQLTKDLADAQDALAKSNEGSTRSSQTLTDAQREQANAQRDLAAQQAKIADLQSKRKSTTSANATLLDIQDRLAKATEAVNNAMTGIQDKQGGVSDAQIKVNDLTKQLADKTALVNKIQTATGITGAITDQQKADEADLVAKGKALLLLDKTGIVAQANADILAKQNLDALDYIYYQAAAKDAANQKAQAKEVQNLNDQKYIQEQLLALDQAKTKKQREAILATLTPGALATATDKHGAMSAENIAYAQDAVAKEEIYKTSLNIQLKALKDFTDMELQLYNDTNGLIGESQKKLEGDLTDSYNRLIEHLNSVQSAAKAALAAQQAVASATSAAAVPKKGGMIGGFFEAGGYTGDGAANQVAGVVHRGEWVAPKWMVKSMSPVFGMLENMRGGKGAFGAKRNGDTVYKQPISMTNNIQNPMDMNLIAKQLAWHLRTS